MVLQTQNSKRAFQKACEVLPGGVDSPVRAAKAVGSDPLFIAKGLGSHIWDIDNNAFIDYVGSWGPLILGHAHPEVIESVQEVANNGLSFGAPTLLETELADEILAAYPSMDKVRLVTSGTEATMSALRLARGVTGRDIIVKFEGCYHGHSDALLVRVGSGALTAGVPTSAGVPEQTIATTLVTDYNDIGAITAVFERYGESIAAVIVEPVAGNMGVVLPQNGFLKTLRELTHGHGSLLIFDEVMTGFRVAFGGAQAAYDIEPDITCLGKIIGGGLPLAAYGGKAHIMAQVSPEGPVYQAGTLAGNPLAVTAGLATIHLLKQADFHEKLEAKTKGLAQGIRDIASGQGISLQVNQTGAMLSVFFAPEEVRDFKSAQASDAQHYALFYQSMLNAGIYLPPSQFESWFVSAAHSEEDIATTLQCVEHAIKG